MDNKRPRKKRKNDSLINYIMIALVVILVLALIAYIISSVLGLGGDKKNVETKPEEDIKQLQTIDEEESKLESLDLTESEKELNTENESESESEKETETETESEGEVESEKEVESESEREIETESERETQRETQREESRDNTSNVDTTNDVDRSGNRNNNNPYAAIVSDKDVRNASDSELVDMIIRGDLGYGQERVDILKKNGIDPDYISRLVNQKLGQ